MGGVGSVDAWVRGWRGLNFCVSGVWNMGPQNFGVGDLGGVG